MQVGTTPVQVLVPADAIAEIQNLGDGATPPAGNLYIGDDNTVSTATGLKVAAGGLYASPRPVSYGVAVWVVSDSTIDVRVKAS
jgi:hypothetical protein